MSFFCMIGFHDWIVEQFNDVKQLDLDLNIPIPIKRACPRCKKKQVMEPFDVNLFSGEPIVHWKDIE